MPTFFTLVWTRLFGMRLWHVVHLRAALAVLLFTAAVLVASSAVILPLEKDAPNATITTFPHALWWSVETATTVGYGDMYPVTTGGRITAAVVMLVGITAFSVITAALATWFVGKAAKDLHRVGTALHRFEKDHTHALADQLHAMHERFDRLEHRLENRRHH